MADTIIPKIERDCEEESVFHTMVLGDALVLIISSVLWTFVTFWNYFCRYFSFLANWAIGRGRHTVLVIFPFSDFLAFMYNRFGYDSTRTVKPGWTENLEV